MKIFVIGDMGELGDNSALLHRQSGESLAKELGIDACYTLDSRRFSPLRHSGRMLSHLPSQDD